MTNTIEALDQFTQALGPMLPLPSPLGPSRPGEPKPAPAQASQESALPPSGDAALTGAATREAGTGPDPLSALPDAVRSRHWHGAAVPEFPLPPAHSSAAGIRRSALSPDNPPHPYPAAVTAAGAERSQPAATRSAGITRKGPRGDWTRRARLAVLALTIGLGLPRIVRATERVGESYWRQEIGKSLTNRQHGHPSPFVLRTLPLLSSTARANHP